MGPWPGELAAKHVLYETTALAGILVTRRPGRYEAGTVPILAL
jgi:hypothetical protein